MSPAMTGVFFAVLANHPHDDDVVSTSPRTSNAARGLARRAAAPAELAMIATRELARRVLHANGRILQSAQ